MKKVDSKIDSNAGEILKTLADSDVPLRSAEIAKAAGMETGEVSSRIKILKKQGLIESPVRCKYSITDEGKKHK